MDINLLKDKVTELLSKELNGNFPYSVSIGSNAFGPGKYVRIIFSCSVININNVSGQMPQVVSFRLEEDLELKPQIYGGMGGQCIYRKPDLNNPAEKYLAMKSEKVPFRTPTKDIDKVLKCLSTFIGRYKDTLKQHRAVLLYQDIVDYDKILA